jgi:NADH/NAD ratio-sensing transcriptional regulator Rex
MTSRQASIAILPIDEMPDFIRKNGISRAIVAVPGQAAHHTIEVIIRLHPKTTNHTL